MPRKYEEDSLEYYFKHIENIPSLSREEERELLIRAKKGDREAIEKLLTAHLKHVVSIAKRYKDRGVPLADLINEGNLGLLRAIKHYDLSKNTRFISYAIWWVKQAIISAILNQSKDIRVSASAKAKAKEFLDIAQEIAQERGELSTIQDIAMRMGIPEKEISALLRSIQNEIPLEALVREEDKKSHVPEFISYEALPSPDQVLREERMKKDVQDALKILSPREKYIIKRVFGLDGDPPESLAQIGKRLGISRERARQIKARALKKLKERFGDVLIKYISGEF